MKMQMEQEKIPFLSLKGEGMRHTKYKGLTGTTLERLGEKLDSARRKGYTK